MKKVYLMVSGLLLVAGANAQLATERQNQPIQEGNGSTRTIGLAGDRAPGDVLVDDDFSDATNWSLYTEMATVPEWEIVPTTPGDLVTYMDVMASPTNANGFAAFNGVQYLLTASVEPIDAYLEYDADIDVSAAAAVTLEFFSAYRAFNTDQVFVQISTDGGATWPAANEIELYASLPTNDPTVQETVLLDITSEAAGSTTMRVRFRFTELAADPSFGAGYGWMIDDFKVKEAWDYDVAITSSFQRAGVGGAVSATGLDYHMVPVDQIAPIEFSGQVDNLGGVTQSNAKLNVEVTGAGTFSGTSAPADIPVGGSDSMVVATTFTPATVGAYTFTYFFDSDDAEEETLNDTMVNANFAVTDFMYSRDNGVGGSSIGNVTSNLNLPLTIGNIMEIFGDGVIGAVDIVVSGDDANVGQLIYAQVMRYDAGAGAYVYVDQTEDHEITAGENGGAIKLFFDEEIEVSAGDDLLVLAGHYGGAEEARFRLAQTVETGTVLGYTSGSTDPFQLLDPGAVMVRLDMRSFVNIEEEANTNFSIGQNIPNPFNETAVINYELNEAANVSIEFVDMTGKVVNVIDNGEQQAGAYTVEIDGNDFAEGVYYYTFTVGTEKVTKRMVITK